MQEIYKDIVGYEGLYQVSNLGNVKSLKYGKERILKSAINSKGYVVVVLCKNLKCLTKKVHRLVAMAFIPNTENKEQVNHINGIKTDNRVENLEWCTQSENIQHGYNNGLFKSKKGEFHNLAKLLNKQVLDIRKDNRTIKTIALDYNVSVNIIYSIKNYKTWKHI